MNLFNVEIENTNYYPEKNFQFLFFFLKFPENRASKYIFKADKIFFAIKSNRYKFSNAWLMDGS